MSFGNGYNGGRTRMGTKVILNVYDLSPANDCLYPVGCGLHHTGVEISGTEYSFASGAGIFESSTPRDAAPGAKYRESIEMGVYEGNGVNDVKRVIDGLRGGGGNNHNDDNKNKFGPNDYHLLEKNCNHFANAFVWKLLGRQIPPHLNRLANMGSYVSCLLPRKMLTDAPVNNGNNGTTAADHSSSSSSGFQVYGGAGRRSTTTNHNTGTNNYFSGTAGRKLGSGGGNDGNNDMSASTGGGGSGGAMIRGVLTSIATKTTSTIAGGNNDSRRSNSGSDKKNDDLIDRREKARKAALARFENQQSEG